MYAPRSRPNSSLSMSAGGIADPHHVPMVSRAQVVDRLREHFLSGAGFAEQKNSGRCRCHLFDLCERALDHRAFGDDGPRRAQNPDISPDLDALVAAAPAP